MTASVSDDARPQHEKLAQNEASRAAVADFLDWLETQGLTICDLNTLGAPPLDFSRYLPCYRSKSNLIAGFLGIDEAALEKEKRAMLAELRSRQ